MFFALFRCALGLSLALCAIGCAYGNAAAYRSGMNFIGGAPSVSPDGQTIAFSGVGTKAPKFWPRDRRAGADAGDIYTVSLEGRNLRRLAEQRGFDGEPCFSPDGKQIAYVSDCDSAKGWESIWIMDRDGSNARRLSTTGKWNDSHPFFSPDGQSICFNRKGDVDKHGRPARWFSSPRWEHANRIFTLRLSGLRETQLTSGTGTLGSPYAHAFAPDGKSIYVTLVLGLKVELWQMNADGGGLHRVENAPREIIGQLSVTPTGRKMAVRMEKGGISVFNVETGATEDIPPPPSLSWGRPWVQMNDPVFVGDGSKILVFATENAGARRGLASYWLYDRPTRTWREVIKNYDLESMGKNEERR